MARGYRQAQARASRPISCPAVYSQTATLQVYVHCNADLAHWSASTLQSACFTACTCYYQLKIIHAPSVCCPSSPQTKQHSHHVPFGQSSTPADRYKVLYLGVASVFYQYRITRSFPACLHDPETPAVASTCSVQSTLSSITYYSSYDHYNAFIKNCFTHLFYSLIIMRPSYRPHCASCPSICLSRMGS